MNKVARVPNAFTTRATSGAVRAIDRTKTVEPNPSVPRFIPRSFAIGALMTAAPRYVTPLLMAAMAARAASSFHP